ncbi:MAG: hypothetical protein IJH12_03105 [Clostridia bacterium]|nr:hypothetical protein [Clostridia bacterium]
MKIIKKILIILVTIVGSVIILLRDDYIRLNASYFINKSKYEEVFSVQGNTNKYVPQGLTYSNKYNVAMQTSYNSNHEVSMLYITDFSTGELIKSLELRKEDGSNNTGHVGGITTDNNTVWITNDYVVHEYSLYEIMSTEANFVRSNKDTKLPIRGDFCYYGDHILWIGDFFLNPFYKVPDNNPLLFAYNTEIEYNYSEPKLIISLPKMVQGMTILPDKRFVFTASFTNLVKSDLMIYSNILETEQSTYNYNGKDIPYYKFDKNSEMEHIKLPPMAEGLFNIDNDLYILFENSSDKYFYALPKMKKIIKYHI